MDLAFLKVQELLLPGLSALCALSDKLVGSIKSGDAPNTTDTLTVILDIIALLCNANHKLIMKRREFIKNPNSIRLTHGHTRKRSKHHLRCLETIS